MVAFDSLILCHEIDATIVELRRVVRTRAYEGQYLRVGATRRADDAANCLSALHTRLVDVARVGGRARRVRVVGLLQEYMAALERTKDRIP